MTVEGEKDYLLEIASNTFISPAARHHEEVRDGRPLSHICKLGGVSDRFGDFYGSLICSTGQNRCKNLGKNGKKNENLATKPITNISKPARMLLVRE